MQIGSQLIESGCEKKKTVSTRTLPNRYDPSVIDTIKTIRCDGVEMEIYVSKLASDPKGLAVHVEITRRLPEIPSYLNVGSSISQLTSVLGKPTSQSGSTITYQPNESEDSVTFSVRNAQIESIYWAWYID